jgi:smad nuclear-interacting protein 1
MADRQRSRNDDDQDRSRDRDRRSHHDGSKGDSRSSAVSSSSNRRRSRSRSRSPPRRRERQPSSSSSLSSPSSSSVNTSSPPRRSAQASEQPSSKEKNHIDDKSSEVQPQRKSRFQPQDSAFHAVLNKTEDPTTSGFGSRTSASDADFGKKGEGEDGEGKEENKAKPNFGKSGLLTAETNTFNGVVVKYNPPADAKMPTTRWRLYQFKGAEDLPIIYIHRQSTYLIGRERKVFVFCCPFSASRFI